MYGFLDTLFQIESILVFGVVLFVLVRKYVVHDDVILGIIGKAPPSLPLGNLDELIISSMVENSELIILLYCIHGILCFFSSFPDHLDFPTVIY